MKCEINENIEAFLKQVEEEHGAELADECRMIAGSEPGLESEQILRRAKAAIREQREGMAVPIEDLPFNS